MNQSNPREPRSAGVSAPLAVAMAVISFIALVVLGLGFWSLLAETDVISVPGLGQAPGVIGMAVAMATLGGSLAFVLRSRTAPFSAAFVIALLTALMHVGTVWMVVASGGALLSATAVVGQLILGGASAIIAVAALIAAWGGIALRRTHVERPRWPWERNDS